MRVLLVISEVPPIRSGVARVAERLQQGLEARGHVVTTVSSGDMKRLVTGRGKTHDGAFLVATTTLQAQRLRRCGHPRPGSDIQ